MSLPEEIAQATKHDTQVIKSKLNKLEEELGKIQQTLQGQQPLHRHGEIMNAVRIGQHAIKEGLKEISKLLLITFCGLCFVLLLVFVLQNCNHQGESCEQLSRDVRMGLVPNEEEVKRLEYCQEEPEQK